MSGEINFRIVIVPEIELYTHRKEELYTVVKDLLELCDLEVYHLSFFQVKKSDEEFHPEIEELILQVDAKPGKSYPKLSYRQYNHFCKNWKKCFSLLPCHYIMLYSEDAFLCSWWTTSDIRCHSLQLGVLPHDGKYHEYATFDRQIYASFYHDTRNAVLHVGKFILEFSYDNIRNVFVNIESFPSQLFFDLYNPPIIFTLEEYVRGRFKTTIRRRNLNMDESLDPDILGRANVLCLTFSDTQNDLMKIISNIRLRCSLKPIFFSCISIVHKIKPSEALTEKLNEMQFSCTYMMTSLFKRNFVLLAQIYSDDDLQKVIGFSILNPEALEKTLSDILLALESGKIVNYWHALEDRFNYYVTLRNSVDFKEYIIPTKCFMTRRIIITPTRLMLYPPVLLFGNRIIRKFESDFAIRVSFRDDNMQRLTTVAQNADDYFLEFTINRPLNNGLLIGNRKYEFLAWSNSQLRDHSVWMYARDSKDITSATIRKWMGEFSHIHNIPKYMARMGLCFSQTVDTISVPLHPQSVRTVPDIVGGYDPESKKPYIFSDGIGRISTELAAKVHEVLESDKFSCAFQIRYKGYKGMLVVDPTLNDVQIEFRESMKKFDCPNSTRLEIARTSAPIPLQLNRPFIALLNDLGVRNRVFMRLQENMLKELTDMLFDEKKAVECLKQKTQCIYDYEVLSQSGIHLTTEIFFRNILLAVHRHQIGCLKSKANVSIDPNYGRNMLGVLDETGILNYGEVFVQYSKEVYIGQTTKETVILEREVLVTKSPCHHPGDVRKFLAIDVPQLHHIVDCIVFPKTGMRPHPSEMAGADLDGDEFAVIWLPELIFLGPNKPAAHFPNMKCKDTLQIDINDMIKYLQDYIKKDQVGKISSSHLALVDRFGVEADICKAVARKVSIAVDFPKSGTVEFLKPEEKPEVYPDFMQKFDREEYKSQKALGKMYRICQDYETENRETSKMYQPVKVDPDLVYPGWQKYQRKAIEARKKYDTILSSLLRNYGIEHEAEVISGAFTDLHCHFQERNDRMDVMKVLIDCFKKLMSDTLSEFMEEFTKCCKVEEMDEAMLQKASAWYCVTYSDLNARYLSFPWSVHKYLSNIKMRKTIGKITLFSPAIIKMDEKIEECEKDNLLPDYKETVIWSDYEFSCDPQIVKRALKVLILWAQEEEIIEVPGRHRGLLFTSTFIKLFLHVAKLNNYVSLADTTTESDTKSFSSAKLCIEFLKFCSSLRFYFINDIRQVLPFFVYKHTKLAKRAVLAYHKFALSGLFRTLYFDRKIDEDLIDMKPFPVSIKLFQTFTDSFLEKVRQTLIKYSGAQEVRLRKHRQTKKIWISAVGTERAIKELKNLFRKKPEFICQFLITGEISQEKVISDKEIENVVDKNSNSQHEDDSDEISIIAVFENGKRKNNDTEERTSKKTKF